MTIERDLGALARSIIDANRFMTLATADAEGLPWVSPVWYAPKDPRELFWVSSPDARHSRNIAVRPQVAIVIFDSHLAGGWESLYMSAVAEEVADIDDAIATFSRRSEAQGLPAWTRENVVPPARHRLYRASVSEHFVLDGHDQRRLVTLDELLGGASSG
ncbi:MAG TPA: pyridoxamine 5'-phosphate oxidase family protein [Gaiella sp.]|nr:pyridoxamine 5'-phosphate oxidase family protein [Gaiella sp.]